MFQIFYSFFHHYLFSSKSNSLVKSISVISILGLMASIASLLVVMSIMSGLGSKRKERMLATEPHLVVFSKNQSHPPQSEDLQLLQLLKELLQKENLLTQIQSMRIFETQDLIIRNSFDQFAGGIGRGYLAYDLKETLSYHKRSYKSDMNKSVDLNWNPSSVKNKIQKNQGKKTDKWIHIGDELSFSLLAFTSDTLTLLPAEVLLYPPSEIPPLEEVKVASIVRPGIPSMLSKTIFYEMNTLPSLTHSASLSRGVEIFLNLPDQYLIFKQIFEKQNLTVESWKDRHSSLFFALSVEKWIMALFLTLASLIACFSLSSMIFLLITQKKKDIGILMTMGLPLREIKHLFLMISMGMSFLGIVGGLLLGWCLCLFIQHSNYNFLPSIYLDRSLPVLIDFYFFLSVFISSLTIAFIISLIPIQSVSFSTPVDLLKKSIANT